MSEELVLRQVNEFDRWTLWEWRNSERIRRVSIHDEEIPRDSHDQWFTKNFLEMRDRTIIVEWNDSPVGWYQIEQWDSGSRSGEWGVALGEKVAPRGLGSMLPLLAHSHAFDRLNASKMSGRVLALNTRMLSIMSRLKFPRVDSNEPPVPRLDGSTSELVMFRIHENEWDEIRRAGLSLAPTLLRPSLDRVLSSPIRG